MLVYVNGRFILVLLMLEQKVDNVLSNYLKGVFDAVKQPMDGDPCLSPELWRQCGQATALWGTASYLS